MATASDDDWDICRGRPGFRLMHRVQQFGHPCLHPSSSVTWPGRPSGDTFCELRSSPHHPILTRRVANSPLRSTSASAAPGTSTRLRRTSADSDTGFLRPQLLGTNPASSFTTSPHLNHHRLKISLSVSSGPAVPHHELLHSIARTAAPCSIQAGMALLGARHRVRPPAGSG
jgi:hypothetical protein